MARTRWVFALVLCSTVALAEYARVDTEQVPIGRVIANLTAITQSQSGKKSKEAWLNLGRAHGMAAFLENDEAMAPIVALRAEPGVMELWWGDEPRAVPFAERGRGAAPKPTSVKHLHAAIIAMRTAESIDADDPVIVLGLGWLLAQDGLKTAAREKVLRAFELAWEREQKQRSAFGNSVAQEAIEMLRPLLDTQKDAATLKRLDEAKAKLLARPRMVTPLVIPLAPDLTLAEVATSQLVQFDADGSGTERWWTWITSKGGWLVYAPTGRVDSALQLFGSVTFWLFWDDGYRALSVLDDDQSGAIEGRELDGLSVWNDRNHDGRTDAGELVPVAALHITSISCVGLPPVDAQRAVAENPTGVTFDDGTTRPTWDVRLIAPSVMSER